MTYLRSVPLHAFGFFLLVAVATRAFAADPAPISVQMETIRNAWKEHRAMSRSISGRVEATSLGENAAMRGYTEWFFLNASQGVTIHRPAALASDRTEKESTVFSLNHDYAFTLRCRMNGVSDTPAELMQQSWRPVEFARNDPANPERIQGIKNLLRSPNLKLTLVHDNLDGFIFGESSVRQVMHEGDKTIWIRVVASAPTTTIQSVDLTLDKDNCWVVKKAAITATDGEVLTISHSYRLAEGFPVITDMHVRSSRADDIVAASRATLEYPPNDYPDSQFRASAFGIAEPEFEAAE